MSALPRNRSLNGCDTCRTRHVKCDEKRPACDMCQRSHLVCRGYQSRVQFLFDGMTNGVVADRLDDTRFRRPLFTEMERQEMSDYMRASMGRTPASKALTSLDEQSQRWQYLHEDELSIAHGPFSVLKLAQAPTTPKQVQVPEVEFSEYISPPGTDSPRPLQLETAEGTSNSPDHLLEMALGGDTTLDLLELMDSDFNEAFPDTASLFTDLHAVGQADDGLLPSAGLLDIPNHSMAEQAHHGLLPSPIPPSLPLTTLSERLVPQDAGFLLMHYKDHIIKLLSPLKYHRKTPWNVLQLPCAMNTFAELTLGNHPNNARNAVFNGLLAISAFNFTNASSGDAVTYWKGVGDLYKRRAHEFLKLSLRHEVSEPKRAKYKEVLMAMLSMVTLSILVGDIESTRSYLLDAERLVCFKGVQKPKKSRKTRLLHHYYGYTRLFFESTSVSAGTTRAIRNEARMRDEIRQFQPSTVFRFSDWGFNEEQRMLEDKNPELGQNDMHLELPGKWDLTMYPHIYGIPETFLFLLSQATRLGNEREAMEAHPDDYPATSVNTLFQCVKAVEKHIFEWAPPACGYPEGYDATVDPSLLDSNRRVVHHLLLSLHQALIIFFYRRVYDVNPMILQQYAEQTIYHLKKIEEEDQATGGYTAGTVWPGFIAGCEALSTQLQEKFSLWFKSSATASGLPVFGTAKKIAEGVWTKRVQGGDNNISWPTLMREQHLTILCS
ncbi:uncharacterized protein K452DRAFT_236777 [Aplosporella prunicola CBS 121167]|uniref:Zn(2)-C6 fungal-type domain-containing protein n=1 Tax=Aplosporella prunicola CBS 121167 TaxID=1176127 RepID=A0A6A6B118_9PEZI|nr:uncharacterized protein K452DRAFT_236777 [Aplosporella prunicola CBS 121167]KAF2136914.1 hypothetical protein K452DRAFT_236777 [Aplosporella prunicola CBS 121167]